MGDIKIYYGCLPTCAIHFDFCGERKCTNHIGVKEMKKPQASSEVLPDKVLSNHLTSKPGWQQTLRNCRWWAMMQHPHQPMSITCPICHGKFLIEKLKLTWCSKEKGEEPTTFRITNTPTHPNKNKSLTPLEVQPPPSQHFNIYHWLCKETRSGLA